MPSQNITSMSIPAVASSPTLADIRSTTPSPQPPTDPIGRVLVAFWFFLVSLFNRIFLLEQNESNSRISPFDLESNRNSLSCRGPRLTRRAQLPAPYISPDGHLCPGLPPQRATLLRSSDWKAEKGRFLRQPSLKMANSSSQNRNSDDIPLSEIKSASSSALANLSHNQINTAASAVDSPRRRRRSTITQPALASSGAQPSVKPLSIAKKSPPASPPRIHIEDWDCLTSSISKRSLNSSPSSSSAKTTTCNAEKPQDKVLSMAMGLEMEMEIQLPPVDLTAIQRPMSPVARRMSEDMHEGSGFEAYTGGEQNDSQSENQSEKPRATEGTDAFTADSPAPTRLPEPDASQHPSQALASLDSVIQASTSISSNSSSEIDIKVFSPSMFSSSQLPLPPFELPNPAPCHSPHSTFEDFGFNPRRNSALIPSRSAPIPPLPVSVNGPEGILCDPEVTYDSFGSLSLYGSLPLDPFVDPPAVAANAKIAEKEGEEQALAKKKRVSYGWDLGMEASSPLGVGVDGLAGPGANVAFGTGTFRLDPGAGAQDEVGEKKRGSKFREELGRAKKVACAAVNGVNGGGGERKVLGDVVNVDFDIEARGEASGEKSCIAEAESQTSLASSKRSLKRKDRDTVGVVVGQLEHMFKHVFSEEEEREDVQRRLGRRTQLLR